MTDAAAYLGPAGSFSEAAARRAFGAEPLVPLPTLDDVARHGRGVLPLHNSVAGPVPGTFARLAQLSITGVVVLAVRHHLLARPGTSLDDVRVVRSHPMALAQCGVGEGARKGWTPRAASSTSAAAEEVAAAAAHDEAALGTEAAAARAGLVVVARDLQLQADNRTRFIVIGPEESTGPIEVGLCPGPVTDASFSVTFEGVTYAEALTLPDDAQVLGRIPGVDDGAPPNA